MSTGINTGGRSKALGGLSDLADFLLEHRQINRTEDEQDVDT